MKAPLMNLYSQATASFDDETMIKANDDQLNDWMMPLIGAFESTFEVCSMNAHCKSCPCTNILKIIINRNLESYLEDCAYKRVHLGVAVECGDKC